MGGRCLVLLLFLVLGQEITAGLGLGSEDHPEQPPDGHVSILDAVQDQDQGGDHSVEQLEVLPLQERLDFQQQGLQYRKRVLYANK